MRIKILPNTRIPVSTLRIRRYPPLRMLCRELRVTRMLFPCSILIKKSPIPSTASKVPDVQPGFTKASLVNDRCSLFLNLNSPGSQSGVFTLDSRASKNEAALYKLKIVASGPQRSRNRTNERLEAPRETVRSGSIHIIQRRRGSKNFYPAISAGKESQGGDKRGTIRPIKGDLLTAISKGTCVEMGRFLF